MTTKIAMSSISFLIARLCLATFLVIPVLSFANADVDSNVKLFDQLTEEKAESKPVDTSRRAPEVDPNLFICMPMTRLGIVNAEQYAVLVQAAEDCFFRAMAAGEIYGPKSWVESLDQEEFNIDAELMDQNKKYTASAHNYDRTKAHLEKLVSITNRAINSIESYRTVGLFWPEGVSSDAEAKENPEYLVASEKIDAIVSELKKNRNIANAAMSDLGSLEQTIKNSEENIQTLSE